MKVGESCGNFPDNRRLAQQGDAGQGAEDERGQRRRQEFAQPAGPEDADREADGGAWTAL